MCPIFVHQLLDASPVANLLNLNTMARCGPTIADSPPKNPTPHNELEVQVGVPRP
jgi:hypothetical protein